MASRAQPIAPAGHPCRDPVETRRLPAAGRDPAPAQPTLPREVLGAALALARLARSLRQG